MDIIMLSKELPNLKIQLEEEFILPDPPSRYTILRYRVEDVLSHSFITELSNNNLALREVQLFISPPQKVGSIHIDGHRLDSDIAAINYVINNNLDWSMQWFNAGIDTVNECVSPDNTNYISFTPSQCNLISEFKTSLPFIVQVGTPHRIVNFSSMPRYCLSLRFKQNNFNSILNNTKRYC